jgi:hypothetical protein
MGIGYGIARALSEGTAGFMQGRQQAEALQRQRMLEDEERRRRAEMDAFNQKYREWQMGSADAEAQERREATQRGIDAENNRKELWGYAEQGDPRAITDLMAMGDRNIGDFIAEPKAEPPRAPVMGSPEWQEAQRFLTNESIRREKATQRPLAGPRPEKPETFQEYFRGQVNRGRIDRLRQGDPINDTPGMSEEQITSLLYDEFQRINAMSSGGPPKVQRREYNMFANPFEQQGVNPLQGGQAQQGRQASDADIAAALQEAGGDEGRAMQILRERGFSD